MTPRFDLIGLIVSDMAASLAFYRRLGLVFPEGSEEQPHVEAPLPGGMRFALDTEDVDATYDELVAAGYQGELKPWDAFWGQRYAVVNDPDGNGVDLFAWLASE